MRGKLSTFAVLGLPTLGLSLSITTVAAFVPVLLRRFTTSSVVAGAIVGGEGALALFLPLLLGAVSDRTRTRIGPRLPYLLAAVPLCVGGLVGIPFAGSLLTAALGVFAFYVGYYVYYPPYHALYPDILRRGELGRSQGAQTVFREVGLGGALVGGPLMLSLHPAVPFLVAAGILAATTFSFVLWIRRQIEASALSTPSGPRGPSILSLVRGRSDLVRILAANSLWELAIAGIRAFVVLYLVVGTGRSEASAALLMGIFAVVAIVSAPIAGHLADRHGAVRVARIAVLVFGVGLFLPALTSDRSVLLPALPVIGAGGAVAMTLPYALLAERFPRTSHGVGAGLYDFSRGIGVLTGPVLTGLAIDVLSPWFERTHGYAAMWLVCGAAVLISVPLLPAGEPRAVTSERAARSAR